MLYAALASHSSMNQIISRQETCKIVPKKQTLHEWMCFEAENVVRHNWSDVAIHDKKILEKMLPCETRLWIIYELGSFFLPMYSKLARSRTVNESNCTFSAVEVHMLRFVKEDALGSIQGKIARDTSNFYFITKGYCDYDYSVACTDYKSVMDLVFCGKANFFIN